MNLQPIEKQRIDASGNLDIHSVFLTIQGEGPFVGERAVFVRLAGCNLQCPGCDTDYTSKRTTYSPGSLVSKIRELTNDVEMLVVFTGGEPLLQNLVPACDLLNDHGYIIQIETNGTLFLDLPDYVVVVCSPKAGTINPQLASRIHALKYVVKAGDIDPKDGLPLHALDHSCGSKGVAKWSQVVDEPGDLAVYIQPMDEKDDVKNAANLKAAIESVMKHDYTLGIQVHKIIGVE